MNKEEYVPANKPITNANEKLVIEDAPKINNMTAAKMTVRTVLILLVKVSIKLLFTMWASSPNERTRFFFFLSFLEFCQRSRSYH